MRWVWLSGSEIKSGGRIEKHRGSEKMIRRRVIETVDATGEGAKSERAGGEEGGKEGNS